MKEYQIQMKAASHFLALEKALQTFTFFAVPNGEKRDIRTAAKLKAMGVKAGVHDFVFLGDKGKTVLIELKADKGKPSENQKYFHGLVSKLGHASFCVPATDGTSAIKQIEDILKTHQFAGF